MNPTPPITEQDIMALHGSINVTLQEWRDRLDLAVLGLDTPVLEMPDDYRQRVASKREAFSRQLQLDIVTEDLYFGIHKAREFTGKILKVHNPAAPPEAVIKDQKVMIPADWRKSDETLSWTPTRSHWNEILISPDHSPHPARVEEDRALVYGLYQGARLALAADRANQAVAYNALQLASGRAKESYRSHHEEHFAVMRMTVDEVGTSIGRLLAVRTHHNQHEETHHRVFQIHIRSAPNVHLHQALAVPAAKHNGMGHALSGPTQHL